MIQVTPNTKIRVAHDPVNFKFGIDGLAALVRRELLDDPMSGQLFIFRNKKHTMLRILYYDGQGFYLCTKRLSKGRFPWWPSKELHQLSARQFQVLLWAGNPMQASFQDDWRRIA